MMNTRKEKIDTSTPEWNHHRIRNDIMADIRALMEAASPVINEIIEKRCLNPKSVEGIDYLKAVMLGFMNIKFLQKTFDNNLNAYNALPMHDEKVEMAGFMMSLDWRKFMAVMFNLQFMAENDTVEREILMERHSGA